MGFANKDAHQHAGDYEADMYTGITTFHGLVRIYNSKHWWGRAFWIVLSGTAMCLFFLQTFNLMMEFHLKPISTIQNFQVPSDGIEFPDITICNFNPAKLTHIKIYYPTMSNDTIKYVLMHYLQVENLYTQFNKSEIEFLKKQYENYKKEYNATNGKEFNVRDFYMNSGYDCEEMFKECMFGGVKITNCCEMAEPVLTDLGKCFKFRQFGNTSWTTRQLISGAFYGLQMVIDVDQDDYPPVFVGDFFDAGVKFYIHPEGVLPLLGSVGSAVPPGRKGFGAVTVRNLTFLNPDNWGKCQEDFVASENQSVWLSNATYTSSNCETNCIINNFYNNCSCVPLRYYYFNDTSRVKICDPQQLYECINVTQMTAALVVAETETYWYTKCACEIECRRVEYNVEMSYSAIPAKAAEYSLAIQYNVSKKYIEDNFLMLNVFMKEIDYQKYDQQKSISRTAVLSDIGGNMGMFLGMSVITLGEIFVFFVKFLWGSLHARRRKELNEREVATQTDGREDEKYLHAEDSMFMSSRYQTLYSELGRIRGNLPAGTAALKVRTVSFIEEEAKLDTRNYNQGL